MKEQILPHPLTNFEIQNYYENESKFNSIYARNNSSEIKDGAYLVNLDDPSISIYLLADANYSQKNV